MASEVIKKLYEDWFRKTQPKDQPATQIIEVRRAFYSGAWALFTGPLLDMNPGEVVKEFEAFFAGEVATGYGKPKDLP